MRPLNSNIFTHQYKIDRVLASSCASWQFWMVSLPLSPPLTRSWSDIAQSMGTFVKSTYTKRVGLTLNLPTCSSTTRTSGSTGKLWYTPAMKAAILLIDLLEEYFQEGRLKLERDPTDLEVVKKRYSAFFRTNLDELLQILAADLLIIGGIKQTFLTSWLPILKPSFLALPPDVRKLTETSLFTGASEGGLDTL
jgi:hypothetical protein